MRQRWPRQTLESQSAPAQTSQWNLPESFSCAVIPRDVVRAITLSRAAYQKIVQNLMWATVYNVIAIPAAAGMFIRWGVNLPMSVGAIAMNLSTIIVALNAQLLRRAKLGS